MASSDRGLPPVRSEDWNICLYCSIFTLLTDSPRLVSFACASGLEMDQDSSPNEAISDRKSVSKVNTPGKT
jgi:hypothetical protein